MHTVCHSTTEFNPRKLKELAALVRAFNAERAAWVDTLKGLDKLELLDGPGLRRLRNAHVKAKYVSPNGLQARGWKLALTEAGALLDRHWQAQLPSPILAPKKAALAGKPLKTSHTSGVAVDACLPVASALSGLKPPGTTHLSEIRE
jgi:hypothetical protein